jgi:hypothetical protein
MECSVTGFFEADRCRLECGIHESAAAFGHDLDPAVALDRILDDVDQNLIELGIPRSVTRSLLQVRTRSPP